MSNNNQELERKTINILRKGYMPTDNKNLLTFVAICVFVSTLGMLSYNFGQKQAQDSCTHTMHLFGLHTNHILTKSIII